MVFALAELLNISARHRALLWSGLVIGLTAVVRLRSSRSSSSILSVATCSHTQAVQAVSWVLPAVIGSSVLYANELATAFTVATGSTPDPLSGRTEWWAWP